MRSRIYRRVTLAFAQCSCEFSMMLLGQKLTQSFWFDFKLNTKMKLPCFIIYAIRAAPNNNGCYWQSSKGGGYIECLPDYYIKSSCESGSHDSCHVDGMMHSSSFAIECCPTDKNAPFGSAANCQWFGGKRWVINFF